jgi:hypothetical protein
VSFRYADIKETPRESESKKVKPCPRLHRGGYRDNTAVGLGKPCYRFAEAGGIAGFTALDNLAGRYAELPYAVIVARVLLRGGIATPFLCDQMD